MLSSDGSYPRSAVSPSVTVMPTPGEPISTIRRSRELSSSAICSAIRPPSELPITLT